MGSWQVIKHLGEGGTGEVWLARTPQGEPVAVKFLPSAEHAALWEHEVRLLMRLRHPAIASVLGCSRDSGEIFGEDRGPCFWMEYVAGDDLMIASEKAGRDAGKIQDWLVQGLEALHSLHSQDVLHGDLSPGNLRVDSKGDLRLIDFGTASLSGFNSVSKAATLLYLAPERIGGRNLPTCDVYSLGTLFYESLAGVHPRAGARSLSEMIKKAAKPLGEARPDLAAKAPTLARVIDRMIRLDSRERFETADEVLEALRGGVADAAKSQGTAYPVKMIGADEHFEAVGRAVSEVDRRSRVFAVHGVTGTGKRRFLHEVGFQCAMAGLAVKEAPPSALRSHLDVLSESRGALLLPNLEKASPDDLARLASFRRRSLPASGLLVFLTWNDDGLSEDRRRLFDSIAAHPDVEDVALCNLSREEASELLKTEVSDVLWQRTGGNPLLLLEFSSASSIPENYSDLLTGRVSALPPDETGVLQILAAAHEPVGFEELVLAAERDAMDVVLALDRLVSKGLIATDSASGRSRLGVAGLEDVVLGGMEPGEKDLRHRAWWKVLAHEREDSSQKLHHALALEEGAYAASASPTVLEKLRGERRYNEALALADRSIPVVRAQKDPIQLSKLLRMKVNVCNDLGLYRDALGLCEEVRALAAADDPPAVKEAKYWLVTGLIHQNLGNNDEATRRFERLVEECEKWAVSGQGEDKLRPYGMRGHSLLGAQALRVGDLKRARAEFEKGLAFDDLRGWRRAEICRNLAVVCDREKAVQGAAGLLGEARQLYREEGNQEGEYAVCLQSGNLALEHEDFGKAEADYTEAEKIAAARDDDLLYGSVWNNQGILERKRGELAKSLERLQKALDVFRPLGNWVDLAESLKQNAVTNAHVGRFEAAAKLITEIRALAPKFFQAEEKAREAEEALCQFRDGTGLPPADEGAKARLRALYDRLPKPLQVSFEDRFDFKNWIQRQRKDDPS